MADTIFGALLFALICWLVWQWFRPRYVFVVQIDRTRAWIAKGHITAAFVQEFESTCREAGIDRGWVAGVKRGRQTRLVFSKHIPTTTQQRLRNVWPFVT